MIVLSPTMSSRDPRRSGLSPLAIFGLWTVPTLLSTLETVMFARQAGRPIPVARAFFAEAPQWYGWALLTPFIVRMADRFPLRARPRLRHVAAHVGASVACSLLVAMADAAVNMVLRPSRVGFAASTRNWFLGALPATTLAYFAIVVFTYAIQSATNLREREAQLRDAQLAALRMQLQPHFLFNSLNAIMALVRDRDTAEATRALSLLADVLRTTVNAGDTATTTLAEELEFVGRYLDIERLRFGDRLRVTMDVPSELRDKRVPTFVLQPFVENSLKHGILRSRAGNEIVIRARNGAGGLTLTVRDDGRGIVSDAELSQGVGIANARARLAHLYGDAASLKIRNVSPGVEVEICLPRR